MDAEPVDSAASTPVPIHTIGYGGRPMSVFLDLLRQHRIQFVIDVRSVPYSRFQPDYGREALAASLHRSGVRYVFMGDTLGGRPDDPACYTDGHVDYVKCRESPRFAAGLARLRSAWDQCLRVALVCSEAKPEDCHRSKLIGVSLREAGIEVAHVDESGVLTAQDEVIRRLTGGRQTLFGSESKVTTSRKRYLP